MTDKKIDGQDGQRLHRYVGMVVRAGSLTALVLILIGLALLISTPSGREFRPGNAPAVPLDQLFRASSILSPTGIVNLGVITLMAIPVVALVVAIVDLVQERDWCYAAVSLVVLAVVAAGMLWPT